MKLNPRLGVEADKGIYARGSRFSKGVEEMKSAHCQSVCCWRKRPDCKVSSCRGDSLVMLESPILLGTEEKDGTIMTQIRKWLHCSLCDFLDLSLLL